MIYTDPRGKRVTKGEAMIAGRLRDGYKAIVQDGEVVRFSANLMDKAPSKAAVFLTDQPRTPRAGIDAARRQWQADKANAYRGRSAMVEDHARANRSAAPQRAHVPPPTPTNDAAARSSIEDARQAWLADKRNAYRGGRA